MEQRNHAVRQSHGAVGDHDALVLARLLRLEADRLARIRDELRAEREKLEQAIAIITGAAA